MRLLRKILLNLTVVAILLVVLYCIETSNGARWSEHYFGVQNATDGTNISASLALVDGTKKRTPSTRNGIDAATTNSRERNYYNVWCIFTKVTTNSPMRRKFRIFADSLLRLSSVDVALHVIIDKESRDIAEDVIGGVMAVTRKSMKVHLDLRFFFSIV